MMGALSGRDPKETLRVVFMVLSMPVGSTGVSERDKDLITLAKLQVVCKTFEARLSKKTIVLCSCCIMISKSFLCFM